MPYNPALLHDDYYITPRQKEVFEGKPLAVLNGSLTQEQIKAMVDDLERLSQYRNVDLEDIGGNGKKPDGV